MPLDLSIWQGANFPNSELAFSRSNGAVPDVSRPDSAKFYYDKEQAALMLSANGGDWAPIVPGTPATPPLIGLVGDGITDNSFVIQEAIDALIPSGGGTVQIPPGDYLISTGLTIPTNDIVLAGVGQSATRILYQPTIGSAVANLNSASKSGFAMRDLALIGSGGASTIGVDLSALSNCYLSNLAINGFATQINLDGTVACYYNTFISCYIYATAALSGQIGVSFGRSANAQTFIGCRFGRLDKHALIGAGTGSVPNQIQFIACHFEVADTASIHLKRGQGIRFLGGRWESNPIALLFDETNLVRSVIFDPDYVANTPIHVSGRATALTVRTGGQGEYLGQSWGYSQMAAQNRVPNARMEGWTGTTDLLGWSSLSTTNWDTTGFETQEGALIHAGTYAAKAGDGTNNSKGIATANTIVVRDDLDYTFSFWWTTPDAATGMRFGFRCFDSAGSVITTSTALGLSLGPGEQTSGAGDLSFSASFNAHIIGSNALPVAINTYERGGGVYRFPAGTASVRIGFWTAGTGTTKYLYLDDVFFGEGPCPPTVLTRPLSDSGTESFHGALTVEGAATFSGTPAASAAAALLRFASAISSGNANGTYLGANLPASYAGDAFWVQINNAAAPEFVLRGDGAGRAQLGLGRIPANAFTLDVSGNANNGTTGSARFRNQSTGGAAYAALEALSGSADGIFGAAHSAYTSSGLLANRVFVTCGGGTETGISLDANRASQDIRFNVGTLNEQLRLAATGQLRLGSVSTNLGRLQVVGRADEVQARVRGNATQTSLLLQLETSAPGTVFAIEGDGKIRTNQAAAATSVTTVAKALPIYDAAGTLLGYCPLYASFS